MLALASAAPQAERRGFERSGEATAMDGDAGLIEAAADMKAERCLWCDGDFEPRKVGSPQRFCHPKHRDAFHSAGPAGRSVPC